MNYRGYIITFDSYGYFFYLPDSPDKIQSGFNKPQEAKNKIDEIWATEYR